MVQTSGSALEDYLRLTKSVNVGRWYNCGAMGGAVGLVILCGCG